MHLNLLSHKTTQLFTTPVSF